jgi:hypothetical protein
MELCSRTENDGLDDCIRWPDAVSPVMATKRLPYDHCSFSLGGDLQLQVGFRVGFSALVGKEIHVQPYTAREKAKITAGAIAALVVVGWLAALAIAFMSAR